MTPAPHPKCAATSLEGAKVNLLEEAGGLFKALGDPSRLRLLQILLAARGPLVQHELARLAGLQVSNASKHLTLLVREGLVRRHTEGTQARFEVVAPMVAEVCDLVCGHVSHRIQESFKSLS
ncbi:MAG: winged helix-turn-helix transcriptional regulator [Holophagaceae bacterium]|nr:winged helix-turn-helix transcriptional regulator [Holophagaceae bacterium]